VSGSTADTAEGDPQDGPFLVGTVWRDGDDNGRYNAGEGIGGVRVEPLGGAWFARTNPAGGFAVPISETLLTPTGATAGTISVMFVVDAQAHYRAIISPAADGGASVLQDLVLPQ
jgi:hypothetical protein